MSQRPQQPPAPFTVRDEHQQTEHTHSHNEGGLTLIRQADLPPDYIPDVCLLDYLKHMQKNGMPPPILRREQQQPKLETPVVEAPSRPVVPQPGVEHEVCAGNTTVAESEPRQDLTPPSIAELAYTCLTCQQTFKTNSDLRMHLAMTHRTYLGNCCVCKQYLLQILAFEAHLRNQHL